MDELKPCPFCGGEVEIIDTGLNFWKYAIRHKNICVKCILDTRGFSTEKTKQEVIEAWNRRVNDG